MEDLEGLSDGRRLRKMQRKRKNWCKLRGRVSRAWSAWHFLKSKEKNLQLSRGKGKTVKTEEEVKD